MPASSEWRAAQQAANDELETAKATYSPYEQEIFKAKQDLDEAYVEAREMEDEAKQRVIEARQSLMEVKESCRELKKNAKDELEDARRRSEPAERRLAEARAVYNTINNSKPEFVGTWDRVRSGKPLRSKTDKSSSLSKGGADRNTIAAQPRTAQPRTPPSNERQRCHTGIRTGTPAPRSR